MERPKKETVYNSLGRREYVLMGEGSLENPVHEKEDVNIGDVVGRFVLDMVKKSGRREVSSMHLCGVKTV